MYNPPAFKETRPEVLHDLIRRHSFGTLVSVLDGEFFATHLPFLLDTARGTHGTLYGHLARANPHWRAFDLAGSGTVETSSRAEATAARADPLSPASPAALVTFQGPHAYISPSWYTTEVAVPTWNYVAVHAYGRPRVVDDPARVKQILAEMVRTYESAFAQPWTMDSLSAEYVDHMAANVVAFEIQITRLEGKRKLSQNRSEADRQGAIAGLRRQGDASADAVASLMANLHDRREKGQ